MKFTAVKKINKLLVANRGEIAIRVFRAASELGIRTVAVFTHEDRYSLHRYKADESYCIGEEDQPLKPYLDIETLVDIAKACGADAIHPGYGFLSENPNFADACENAGIIFVGPSAAILKRLGNKQETKRLAVQAGLPVIAESTLPIDDVAIAQTEAKNIGYPVMIKAKAGGGGRGMRLVTKPDKMAEKLDEAKSEARTAFGDDSVFLERYVDSPKHIEVQILGDQHGNLVHLLERDCSLQRRYQKIVEVAPAPSLTEKARKKLYDYALALGKHVKYTNAGTVEFLVNANEEIFFIEINPRIQVEHTITEVITGIDIVRSQLLISAGRELTHPSIFIKSQDDVKAHGYAIQCRITTEDPENNFEPNYGKVLAYRSAGGFGIRLDAGSAYAGNVISPFFDSLLVKVTSSGRTLKGAAQRLHRALREFRVRGVKTNTDFLLNIIQHETFLKGEATVGFIDAHPDLFNLPRRKDRSTKLLRYLGDVIVNGNPDVKQIDINRTFRKADFPPEPKPDTFPEGTRDRMLKQGRDAFIEWLKNEKAIQFTDTTMRDAHQSLFATRLRTHDMLLPARSYAKHHGGDIFSLEVWGGATFDVAMRFLKECPWQRLEKLRKAIPNICFQMLLRGSNAVGYTAYPDNVIEAFIIQAAESGIDIFRIFDSLNWVESMRPSIQYVREKTDAIAEACICYTGDVSDPTRSKFDLKYYIELAKQLEDEGAHMLAIKDMAGLLKPRAAKMLIDELKEHISLPIHLHTHDTSGIQAATYMQAIESGVDVIDVALSSMSGLTSQPSFNSMVAILKGHERENTMDLSSLNAFSNYWEKVRERYYPFETELRAGTAEVYDHEIPGGQYSNLMPQARSLGLADQFDTIKKNYRVANELLGDLIKVTPASKVVGDLAMFMTTHGLEKQEVLERAGELDFPASVISLLKGELGQIVGGFPKELQEEVLKGETPFTDRPNAHLAPVDLKTEFNEFQSTHGEHAGYKDYLSSKMYPKVFKDYFNHQQEKGIVETLPTEAFFYGLQPNQEIVVTIEPGKTITIMYLNATEPDKKGVRQVFFLLNGEMRQVPIFDQSLGLNVETRRQATGDHEIGAPLPGKIIKCFIKEGDHVNKGDSLFVVEAMKMETTVSAPTPGTIQHIYLKENCMVEKGDLVVELGQG